MTDRSDGDELTPLASEFDRCAAWLEAALLRGEDADRPLGDVRALVGQGRAQLWPGERSALVTQVMRTPEGLCIHFWLGGGDLPELLELRTGAEAWGRAVGCVTASINGRPGWARVLRDRGWRPEGGELTKRLR